MQRALAFMGVVLAVVIVGWLQQRQEISRLRTDLAGATSALSADPDSIVRVGGSLVIGPTAVDVHEATCPAGYRVVYGGFESVSSGSEVFFSSSLGSTKTWWVGLDNTGNADYGPDPCSRGAVRRRVRATMDPATHCRRARCSRTARRRRRTRG